MPAPLTGRRVVVTRAREQAGMLAQRLAEAGATVVEVPVARFVPPHDWMRLDAACDRLSDHAWVAFTSANAVRFTLVRWRERGRSVTELRGPRWAVVGGATAQALRDSGLQVDLIPERTDAEALAEALMAEERTRRSLLLPQADNARTEIGDRLVAAGWKVTAVVAYRAEPIPVDPFLLREGADAVTFASAATVQRFVAGMGPELCRLVDGGCRFYAIGPQTAAAVAGAGLRCAGTAGDATIDALVALVVRDLGRT